MITRKPRTDCQGNPLWPGCLLIEFGRGTRGSLYSGELYLYAGDADPLQAMYPHWDGEYHSFWHGSPSRAYIVCPSDLPDDMWALFNRGYHTFNHTSKDGTFLDLMESIIPKPEDVMEGARDYLRYKGFRHVAI